MTETRHDQLIRERIADQPANYHSATIYGRALLAVLDLHPYNEEGRHCEQCIDPADDSLFVLYPCPTVETIAKQLEQLGVDAQTGPGGGRQDDTPWRGM